MRLANLTSMASIIIALVMTMAWIEGADAKAACSEGRTSSGACIKPVMAAAQRKIMVAFTQPKISQSSKLISSVAAPAQIAASVQNVTVAQASASTFENLRGPASYEAQTNYGTTMPPSFLSTTQYLSPAEFKNFQDLLADYYLNHNSSLYQFVVTHLKDPATNVSYFVTVTSGTAGQPGATYSLNSYNASVPRSIFMK